MSNSKRKLFFAFQIVLFSLGLFLLSGGKIISINWNEILSGIGIAFISTSLISLFSKFFLVNNSGKNEPNVTIEPDSRSKINLEIYNWGLIMIHRNRCDKNEKVNSYIEKHAMKIDIMTQDSLHSLRLNMENELTNRLTHGMEMRILLPSEKELRHFNKNKELVEWWTNLPENQRNNIKIRRYEGTPQDLYFRVDNMIFIGPYILGVQSNQSTITYEFELCHSDKKEKTDEKTKGGKLYSEYFERIWRESAKYEIKRDKP